MKEKVSTFEWQTQTKCVFSPTFVSKTFSCNEQMKDIFEKFYSCFLILTYSHHSFSNKYR